MNAPMMLYFGPWDQAGHHFHGRHGGYVSHENCLRCPWQPHQIDCGLQAGCVVDHRGHLTTGKEIEGDALLHHKDGWTALSFWDRTIDTRGRCNSTYLAEGTFTFNEMVALAKENFSRRWNHMKFEVRDVTPVAQGARP